MEEWKEYKLGELITLNSGGTPDKNNKSYWDGDIPWISAKFMYDDYLYSSELKISQDGLTSGSRLAPKGSILLLTRGSGLFNRIPVCYTMRDLAYNQDVKCIESKNKGLVSTEFLFYWLMGNKDSISAILETTGIGAGKIDTNRLKNVRISLPPNEYQQILIGFAESIMHKIEVNRRINDNLEQEAQALFKSWFVDFEPFKNGEFVDSELGMIPKGWRVVSLGNLMSYNGGSQPPASEFIEEYKEGYIRFIQIRDYASDGHITYIPVSKRNKLCDVKDIMIARYGASLGRICYGLKGAYNVALAKVSPLKEYYREYLRCFLNTREFYEGINNKGNRAVQAGFNQSDIQSFRLPFPTDEYIVKSFDNLCSYYFERRLLSDQESRRLAEIRDTLLPKLMSGELKVNEIEDVL